MKRNFPLSLVALLLPALALSNEPSAFSAGDLNSQNPYGLTSSEKKIYQSNQVVKAELGSVAEQLEGIRSVIDGYNAKIARTDEKIRQLEEENVKLKEYLEENRKIQADNQEKIKKAIGELGLLIDSINKNYVSKEKFDQLSSEVKGKASPSSKETKVPEKTTPSKALSAKDSATLMKEAEELFEKKAYTESKKIYTELIARNYKPARANFVLGEIAYAQKSYSAAIEHYKTSIGLFDKAVYTPTLLYHTASSFEKLGKKSEARNFYKALKEGYPDSPEAKKVK